MGSVSRNGKKRRPRKRRRHVGRRAFTAQQWRALRDAVGLSPREFEVIQSVFDGRSIENIADRLDLSPHTVRTYLHRLYDKFEVGTRTELVIRVFLEYLARIEHVDGRANGHCRSSGGRSRSDSGRRTRKP